MSPTRRLAALIAAVALSALVLPGAVAALLALAVVGAAAADALVLRRRPVIERRVPEILSRATPYRLELDVTGSRARRLTVRQPRSASLEVDPPEGEERLDARLVASRRGRHTLPPAGVRAEGPLGLAARHHRGEPGELVVYPDVATAQRLAQAVRSGRFRHEGLRRGPLGLGTEFELVRDYLPDDDVRQVNWRATARLGRPMSNQYRVERDRDVVCVIDSGRLMTGPVGGGTRLDAAVDAAVAVALVADALGDRCGVVCFDSELTRVLEPRRAGASHVIRALFDLEPRPVDSDYELAFRKVAGGKRSLLLVLTDVIDESAARPLLRAVPVVTRRHAVICASATDPDLAEAVAGEPENETDVYRAAAAVEVLDARDRVMRRLAAAGAQPLESPPSGLAVACVRAYLRAKTRAVV
jgi:uncharacterized protein (DUF58 family)